MYTKFMTCLNDFLDLRNVCVLCCQKANAVKTDGQTDGQTSCDGIVRAMHSIAR